MEQSKPTNSRKRFLLWGAALLSSITVSKLFPGNKMSSNATSKESVRLLTQDGKLVEVDVNKISHNNGKKISDEQLKNWIIRK